MVEFDDVHQVEKLRIYDKGVDRPPSFTEYSQFLSIRNGDIHIPLVPMVEPLEVECRHFVECVEHGKRPLTDGASALRVVRVLEAAQRSLESRGAPSTFRRAADARARLVSCHVLIAHRRISRNRPSRSRGRFWQPAYPDICRSYNGES